VIPGRGNTFFIRHPAFNAGSPVVGTLFFNRHPALSLRLSKGPIFKPKPIRNLSSFCYFLFLEKKKVTKENSSQTRSLRAFWLANATIAQCLLSTRCSASRYVQLGGRYVNPTGP
jgi:hypothetical protein